MEQLAHWIGQEGDKYIERNGEELLPAYTSMWERILHRTALANSVLEVGANVGINLKAIKNLRPDMECNAIEPNPVARATLLSEGVTAFPYAAEDPWDMWGDYDLVFTRGVLIHINPTLLPLVYENMYRRTRRYMVVAEYFAPKREMIPYRGLLNRLWRADYAGEIMEKYPDMKLLDYFFIYKRDLVAPQDNITVFIMEKT